MRRAAQAAALVWLLAAPAAAAAGAPPGYGGVALFDMPALAAAETQAGRIAAGGNPAGALQIIDQLSARYPLAARLLADKATLEALLDREGDAFASLSAAIAAGLTELDALLARPPLNRIADDPLVEAMRAAAPAPPAPPAPPPPRRLDTGEALVDESNTYWNAGLRRLVASFEMMDAMRRFQIRDGKIEEPYKTLQSWVARGRAAGNVGDLYDNRDNGHSVLSRRKPTQISHVVYSPAAKAAGLNYGLNTQILFDHITIGNSSTAITGRIWRSQPRLALTSPDGPVGLWRLYANNHLYVFPEHRDHDPVTPRPGATGADAKPGHGDLFPANTPYMLISQGSSGSDRPILEALRAALAALTPEVKDFLRERNLVAPMLQQMFRRGQRGVETDADYLSPRAHPPVFDPAQINVGRMIVNANALKAEEIPPLVRLRVESEQADGVENLLGADRPADERLFDTPSAIARLWRGAGYERRYVVGTAGTADPNGRALKFHWVVTQGDAAHVSITPLDEAGTRAEIVMNWAGPAPEALRPDIASPRVDIAVIADNGAALSAPAFFSMLYPAHETRVYEPAPAGGMRLAAIDHVVPARDGPYVDPMIWPLRDWRDDLDYDAEGRLLGWTRTRAKAETRFTPDGLLVRETDEAGRPVSAEEVAYRIERDRRGFPLLAEVPTGVLHAYRYDGPDDMIGERAGNPG